MDGDEANLRNAAGAVLKVYNPAFQHVALAMLGPSTLTRQCNGTNSIPLDILPQPQTQPVMPPQPPPAPGPAPSPAAGVPVPGMVVAPTPQPGSPPDPGNPRQ